MKKTKGEGDFIMKEWWSSAGYVVKIPHSNIYCIFFLSFLCRVYSPLESQLQPLITSIFGGNYRLKTSKVCHIVAMRFNIF